MHVRHLDLSRAATHRQVRRIATASPDAADEAVFAPWPGSTRTNDGPGRPGAVTVLRLQQTVGNQAVQRLLQRDDELIPTPTLGDWKFEPPKPTTETDTTYDTEDEKRRAEQKAADERGESPKPNEWWKDKPRQPKPTDPKDYTDLNKWHGKEKPSGGDSGADFGPLPPAEEQQPGDYPLT
ncbi:MAG: hypothetical protein ACRDJH_18950, partial [Thermomicrobiales bacterium]